nr:hypothetical protein [Candidatus Gracilibacteria bacterium]
GEQIEKRINCFLGFTSRNPSFKRDDLSDRMIILKLNRRNNFKSANISQKYYLDNRNIILSSLCFKIQEIIKNIEVYNDYETNFRISDFSIFTMNSNKDKIDYVNKIFEGLEFNQQELTTSTDSLLLLLENIIDDSKEDTSYGFKEGEYYKSNELHKIFSGYAKKNSHVVNYGFNSPLSLGKSLNNNIKAYKNIYNININLHKCGGNVVKYSFSKGLLKEEIKEIFD